MFRSPRMAAGILLVFFGVCLGFDLGTSRLDDATLGKPVVASFHLGPSRLDHATLGKRVVASAVLLSLGPFLVISGLKQPKKHPGLLIAVFLPSCLASSFCFITCAESLRDVRGHLRHGDTMTVRDYRENLEKGYPVPPLAEGMKLEKLPADQRLELIVEESRRNTASYSIEKIRPSSSGWLDVGAPFCGLVALFTGAFVLFTLRSLMR